MGEVKWEWDRVMILDDCMIDDHDLRLMMYVILILDI